jgi:hypothetical protein
MWCLHSSVGLRPGPGVVKRERDLLAAHCHTDIAGLFAKPRLVAGLGQNKEQVVQNPQPSPFERAIEEGVRCNGVCTEHRWVSDDATHLRRGDRESTCGPIRDRAQSGPSRVIGLL